MIREKSNNRGFTLVELIIAIGIFSIVIFMGYKVINGTHKASATQMGISKEQQGANLLNKYLTQDLEGAKNIGYKNINPDGTLLQTRGEIEYGYEISKPNDVKITYTIKLSDSGKGSYSIFRNDGKADIELITNQEFTADNGNAPLAIVEKSENLYDIDVHYNDNIYNFNVNSRIKSTELGGGDEGDGETISSIGKGHIVVDTYEDKIAVSISESKDGSGYLKKIHVVRSKNSNDVKVYTLSNSGDDLLQELPENQYKAEIKNGAIEVELFNEEVEITIGKNGHVDVEIEEEDSRRINTRDCSHSNENIYIDIEGKYQNEIENIEVKYDKEEGKKGNIKEIYKLGDDDRVLETFGVSSNPYSIFSDKIRTYDSDDREYEITFGVNTESRVAGSTAIINFDKSKVYYGNGIEIDKTKSSKATYLNILNGNSKEQIYEIGQNSNGADRINNFKIEFEKNTANVFMEFDSKYVLIKIINTNGKNIEYIEPNINGHKITLENIKINDNESIININDIKNKKIKSISIEQIKINNEGAFSLKW